MGLLVTACEGDKGPQGAPGPTGPTGPAGPGLDLDAAVVDDGGVAGGAVTADQVRALFNNNDQNLTLWKIQPGLGTVMVEYGIRFNNLWWAAQAQNWDMVTYQILEMREIQEVGEVTRPARAAALKAFEGSFLDPLDQAAAAKDLAAFTTAYDNAISGCNGCHVGTTSAAYPNGYRFVKIIRPTAPHFQNVDFSAAGQLQ
jgi:hypothetical protein